MADGQIVKLRPAAGSFGGPSIVYVVRRRRRTSVVASLLALDRPVQVSSLALPTRRPIVMAASTSRSASLGSDWSRILLSTRYLAVSSGECLLAGLTLIAPLGV